MAGTDSQITVPPDSTGKLVDCDSLTTGVGTVQRERHRVAGAAAAELADVRNAIPGAGDYGLVARIAEKSWKLFNVSISSSGDNNIVTGVVGKRIKVYFWVIVNTNVNLDVDVTWKSGATAKLGPYTLGPRGEWHERLAPTAFLVATDAGGALVLNLSVANAVRVMGAYWDDDAS